MFKNNKKDFNNEGTFESISREEFFINQNFYEIDSFGKCPCCEEETLNLKTNKCECGYDIEYNILFNQKNVKNKVEKMILEKDIDTFSMCSCGNRKLAKSIMCKECYGKYKIKGLI